MAEITPFQVMEIQRRAWALESAGRSIVHMEIGEPDFTAPGPVVDAAVDAVRRGATHYTSALGLPALREAIAEDYDQRYGLQIAPERVVVTAGGSGALLLAMGALVDPGREVLMSDPGYPCNRQFVRFVGGVPIGMPVDASSGFQPTVTTLEKYWNERCAGLILASPSNPTGTLVGEPNMSALCNYVHSRGGFVLVDEIYLGLSYQQGARSALSISDQAFIVNSFSKYYQMTGWRLGWLVVPAGFSAVLERLAQNLFICPSAVAQEAALACFKSTTQEIVEARRIEFQLRRDFLVDALCNLGFGIPAVPQGAFYVYADCSRFGSDSKTFAWDMLERSGVAFTPGMDFGHVQAQRYVRFAYTTSMQQLEEGIRRLGDCLVR